MISRTSVKAKPTICTELQNPRTFELFFFPGNVGCSGRNYVIVDKTSGDVTIVISPSSASVMCKSYQRQPLCSWNGCHDFFVIWSWNCWCNSVVEYFIISSGIFLGFKFANVTLVIKGETYWVWSFLFLHFLNVFWMRRESVYVSVNIRWIWTVSITAYVSNNISAAAGLELSTGLSVNHATYELSWRHVYIPSLHFLIWPANTTYYWLNVW